VLFIFVPERKANCVLNWTYIYRLGYIATRHLILSDYHYAGTIHDDCKALAEMHSTAVDYSKTGIAVEMDRMSKLTRINGRPDL
jgi:hypothetical protein